MSEPTTPPVNTRNAILLAIQTALADAPGMSAERVLIGGVVLAKMASGLPVASIRWEADTGRRADGSQRERTLHLTIGVLVRIDPLSAVEPLLQLGAIYDGIHAKLETLADGDVGTLVQNMTEDPAGVQASGFEDKNQSYTFIATNWTLEYLRANGAI